MEQVDYKGKYEDLIERIKKMVNCQPTITKLAIESFIPEIVESEDDRIRKWLIHYFKEVCDNVSEKEKKGIVAWLEKQPKDSPVHSNSTNIGKVEQKQEWSEEDERKINYLIALLQNSTMNDDALRVMNEEVENWLKSLRPQPHWKPSDEQMEALLYEVYAWDEDSINGQNLKSLYQDLKKLREE